MGSIGGLSQAMLLNFKRAPVFTNIRYCPRVIQCMTTKRCISSTLPSQDGDKQSHKFVFVGGGAGGLSVASYFARKFPNQVAVVEPSDVRKMISNLYFANGMQGQDFPLRDKIMFSSESFLGQRPLSTTLRKLACNNSYFYLTWLIKIQIHLYTLYSIQRLIHYLICSWALLYTVIISKGCSRGGATTLFNLGVQPLKIVAFISVAAHQGNWGIVFLLVSFLIC